MMPKIKSLQATAEAPWIHLHHFMDPNTPGPAETELCCHGCHNALLVRYVLPSRDVMEKTGLPKLVEIRNAFVAKHARCERTRRCLPTRARVELVTLHEA